MAESRITSKGQTTIPIEIRRHLKLKPGDRIEFHVQADGKVVLRPLNVDILEYKGMLGRPRRRVSIDQMDEAIRKAAVERAMRK
jgi:antitoxin PrlF